MRRSTTVAALLTFAVIAAGCGDGGAQPTDADVSLEQVRTAASTTRNWFAPLRFDVEVPPPDLPPGPPAIGAAGFQVSADQQSIFFQLVVARIQNVSMAHIHLGPPGETGPVVVWLYPPGPPPQPIPGEFSGVLGEGTFTAANLVGPLEGQPFSALLDQIRAGNAYVNVHTTRNMPGEIRGQIFAIAPPDPPVQ